MKKIAGLMLVIFSFSVNAGFAQNVDYKGRVYLYGELHGVKKITDKELALWQAYYKKGFRHLFLELPYYTAEYLNMWLKEKDNTILEAVYNDWKGSAFYNRHTFDFFVQIKLHCPQTIFHGTDIGHQYDTTGLRFLSYLETANQKNTPAYMRTHEIISQGKKYYNEPKPKNMIYRENMMVKNFTYELKKLNNADIMGIYGFAHTGLESSDMTGTIPCMANQLKAFYGNAINSEDLSYLAKEIEPIRTDTISAGNKIYKAYYYGKQDLNGFKGFLYREFWQLDNAYSMLKDKVKTGDVLPYNNYPMNVEIGNVYVIDYTKTDKTTMRLFYISDGKLWNGQPVTENIVLE